MSVKLVEPLLLWTTNLNGLLNNSIFKLLLYIFSLFSAFSCYFQYDFKVEQLPDMC